MQPIVQVQHLEKIYGNRSNITKALNGVSFEVFPGEYIGVMGSSGSGKTTLLNCISTIDRATAGQILIEGKDITKLKPSEVADFRCRKLGFIFQDYNLLDTLTAYENIALALTIAKTNPRQVDGKIRAVAEKLGITDVLAKYPVQMSGGQRQRVSSARAIVTHPVLVLADEPTGALDSKSAKALLESFRAMVQELQSTILMVTHDPFAASYCDRILFIRDGRLFTELRRGVDTRKDFFDKIIEVMAVLGGEAE
ncbi:MULTISPECIES: ABC transporter ATP-binding protein [Desulfitobacterium]|uniref:ABC-type antimicrobial peptide transport system, ATPase component n=1 Tax=Desulfitobacterium dehalogenans (strain ATCC 51507 / DSM 9161 / JW/IU-DC1) TaxID=756499 RepID=I4A4S3_DESDJ|nr:MULTISPECIES: ABC transporter ATP-binding protein [Desulfitobacterium]AFL98957.1 ABC-type antimicrobial peptide transport system, ATPase component [Desulfitobacterium dehalogenans ATCC 51507]